MSTLSGNGGRRWFGAAVVALLLIAALTAMVSARVWTDQEDYSPGSVVTISGDNSDGAGYLAGERVAVSVSGPNGYAATCESMVNEAGAWSCLVTLWEDERAVGDYNYLASGQISGITQSGRFTDSAGFSHTCYLQPDGDVDCWGYNYYEQATDQAGPFTQVSAGSLHTCGLKPDGGIHCWGDDSYGQATDQAGPLTQVSAGSLHTCGLKLDGSVDCWGSDNYGQATDQTGPFTQVSTGYHHTCGLNPDGSADCWGLNNSGQATDQTGPFTQVSAGYQHTCGLNLDGSADCWGSNYYGQATDQTGPFTQVSAGGFHTCGLKQDGSADCWGDNIFGQATDQTGPFSQVSAGDQHTCGLKRDQNVTCWGRNNQGQAPAIVQGPFIVYLQSDATPPVLTLPNSITAEATGPTGATVNFTATALDNFDGSVPVTCTPLAGSTFPLGQTTVDCSATDAAGNTANGNFKVTVADTTPPVLTLPADITAQATGPTGAVVTFASSALDLVDGNVPVTCTPLAGSTFPLGQTTVACSATDAAGNTAKGSFEVAVVDTTPPVFTLPDDITAEATGPTGAMVTFTATALDDVDGNVPVSCTPDSGSTFPIGQTTVVCSATDTAGNTAIGSFKVTIVYAFAGFFAPVNNDLLNVAKASSAVPVKFSLGGDYGLGIIASGYPRIVKIVCDSAAEQDNIEETLTAGSSSLQYDPLADQYTYVWKTDKAWANTCRQFQLKLIDGTTHVANFKFK
jgi:hypothetical protein